jgi:C4-dicarboxylate transporter DctQ subunit
MNKMLKHLDNFEEHVIAVLLAVMTIVICIATFSRYTNLFIITWAEELTRYCMVWLTYFGIGAAAKRGEHFCVMAFAGLLPTAMQKILNVIRMALMITFTVVVAKYSLVVLKSQINMGQISPSLKWQMWLVYSVIPIGCIIMTVRYIVHGTMQLFSKESRGAA